MFPPDAELPQGSPPQMGGSQVKLSIDELEDQFQDLHYNWGLNRSQVQGEGGSLSTKDSYLAKIVNSHDFKFSMLPFSNHNNSLTVNLYSPDSKIPFLFKDHVQGVTESTRGIQNSRASLFFQCYQDDIYEAILEDLRAHYIQHSNQDQEMDSYEDEEDGEIGNEGDEEEAENLKQARGAQVMV
mmetsp:Transcript_14868/g.25320  ORF Transcript_14868/g.25320 Transcript_14868/m.25320 type:complete len:184 (-) Transcript_14868:70-621(-)